MKSYVETLLDYKVLTPEDLHIFIQNGSFTISRSDLAVHSDLFRSLENLVGSGRGDWVRDWLVSVLAAKQGSEPLRISANSATTAFHREPKMNRFEFNDAPNNRKKIVEIADIHVTAHLYSEVMGIPIGNMSMAQLFNGESESSLLNFPVFGLNSTQIFGFLNSYSELHKFLPFFVEVDDIVNVQYIMNESDEYLLGYRMMTKKEYSELCCMEESIDDPLKVGWYKENSDGQIQPVGSKKPIVRQGKSIFDLRGNVRNFLFLTESTCGDPITYSDIDAIGKSVADEFHVTERSLYPYGAVNSLWSPCGIRLARTIGYRKATP